MPVNWEGIKRFLGWKGSIEDMKRLELPAYEPERPENDLGIRHIPLPDHKEKAVKDDDLQDVVFEGFNGFTYICLRASKEDRGRLSKSGIVTPYEDEDVYHLHVREGDLVRLRDGRLGTVRMVERGRGGERIVSVDVDGAPRRWFGLRAPLPVRFVDRQINYLKFISTKKDMDATIAECNE